MNCLREKNSHFLFSGPVSDVFPCS